VRQGPRLGREHGAGPPPDAPHRPRAQPPARHPPGLRTALRAAPAAAGAAPLPRLAARRAGRRRGGTPARAAAPLNGAPGTAAAPPAGLPGEALPPAGRPRPAPARKGGRGRGAPGSRQVSEKPVSTTGPPETPATERPRTEPPRAGLPRTHRHAPGRPPRAPPLRPESAPADRQPNRGDAMSEKKVVLGRAAREFADASADPPFIYQLPPERGREILEGVQSGEGVPKPGVIDEWITVEGGPTGRVPVRIVRPAGAGGMLPVVYYIHGAGWVFGSAGTHDRLVRELAVRTGAAVVFPEYDRSPEAEYPTAIEQNYAAA